MNVGDEYLKRLVEAVERLSPPSLTGLHRHDVTERAISIRNTSKGDSLCQWTATEKPIPTSEVNAITGKFTSFKWNIKPKTDKKDGTTSYPKYLMVHMESSPSDVCVIRSNLTSNWSFQLLMALETLPKDDLFDQFTIVLIPNDMEKYDPAVFCKLYHNGVEVKYEYRKDLRENSDYLIELVESFSAHLNPVTDSSASEEHHYDSDSTLQPVTKAQLREIVSQTQPPQSSLVNDQILTEYARLKLTENRDKGKALIQEHFGAGATHKSLTPDQRVKWLEILRKEKVESEPVPEATPEVVEVIPEVVEDIAEFVTPEPAEVEMGSIPADDFRDLITKITVRENELKLTKLQIRGIIQAKFGKTARISLSDEEMLTYLDVLNALEVRQ